MGLVKKSRSPKKPGRTPEDAAPVYHLELARKKKALTSRFDELGTNFASALLIFERMADVLVDLGFPRAYAKAVAEDVVRDWLDRAEVPRWRK